MEENVIKGVWGLTGEAGQRGADKDLWGEAMKQLEVQSGRERQGQEPGGHFCAFCCCGGGAVCGEPRAQEARARLLKVQAKGSSSMEGQFGEVQGASCCHGNILHSLSPYFL